MSEICNEGAMINCRIQDDQNSMGKLLIFILEDHELSYMISREQLFFLESLLDNRSCSTAMEARLQQDKFNSFISHITDFTYQGFNITEDYINRIDLRDRILSTIYSIIIRPMMIEEDVEEKDELPQEIKEALELSEKALKYNKEIREKQKEIEKDKIDYFKKHGTLVEKSKAYIEGFIKN